MNRRMWMLSVLGLACGAERRGIPNTRVKGWKMYAVQRSYMGKAVVVTGRFSPLQKKRLLATLRAAYRVHCVIRPARLPLE